MPNYTEQSQNISFSANISVGIQELSNVQIWQPNTAYNIGDVVIVNPSANISSNGTPDNQILLCVVAGNSQSNVENVGYAWMPQYAGGFPSDTDGTVGWTLHPNYAPALMFNSWYSPPMWAGSLQGSGPCHQYPWVGGFFEQSPDGNPTTEKARLPNGRVIRCICYGTTGGANGGPTPWGNNTIAYGANGFYDQKVLFIGNTVWISDTQGFQYRSDGNTALWIDPSTN